jgi:hypothetical protein
MKIRRSLCILIMGVSTLLLAAETLPTQINDEAFWRMISEFSEAGGNFTSENFVSNEPNFQQVLTRLKAATKTGGAYLGVGPEQNFTYIVALQPRIAFIIDIRRQNMIQHLMYKAAFELSADRADFLSMLFSRKRPNGLSGRSTVEELVNSYKDAPADNGLAQTNLQAIKDLLTKQHKYALEPADLDTIDHIQKVFSLWGPLTGYSSNLTTADFTNGGGHNGNFSTILTTTDDAGVNRSFLESEENFRIIKNMEQRNLIVPLVGDFGGPKTIRAVGQYLKDHESTVEAFYISNVEQYLFQNNPTAVNGGSQNFYNSVATLPLDSTSTFIRSSNTTEVKQPYVGFTSLLGSMTETIQVFKQRGFSSLRDVFALSH